MNKKDAKKSPINQLFLNYLDQTKAAVDEGQKTMKEKKSRKNKDQVAGPSPVVPKNIVLRLLRDGLMAGAISRTEIEKTIAEAAVPDFRVDRNLRDKAKELTSSMGIDKDGLKFSVKSPSPGKLKLYLLGQNNRVAMEGISESFAGIDDMERAAGTIVERYLELLCKNEGEAS